MKRKIIILLLALSPVLAVAQGRTHIYVNFLPSISLGETADYTKNFSPRGVDFEVEKFLSESLSVGFVTSWVVFRDKISDELFEYNNTTISGIQYRYLNTVPINLNVKKYFSRETYAPYVGLGLGTSYTQAQTDLGILSFTDDKWQFNFAPEIGVLYLLPRDRLASFKIKYNYSPKSGDFDAVSYLSFGIGVGLK